MTRLFSLRNRQRVRAVDTALLRCLARQLLEEELRVPGYELAVHLVAAPAMARLNKTYLDHDGSTDVITFDYLEKGKGGLLTSSAEPTPLRLHGEIFICLNDAVAQARQFGTSWQSELARYLIHGLLHLEGFDDRNRASQKKMKREENRLMRNLAGRFSLSKLGKGTHRS